MASQLHDMKGLDDSTDPELQIAAGADDDSDDGRSKEQPVVHETLGQVSPRPISSWLIKIPAELEARWANITEPGVPLGKLRHYAPFGDHKDRQFVLLVPENPPATTAAPVSSASRPTPTASGSKAQVASAGSAQTKEPEMLEYLLEDSGKSNNNLAKQKILYMEDRRRYEFNGTSKKPGHPRIVQPVTKQYALVPKISAEKMARMIKQQYEVPESLRKRTRMLMDEKLTAGQRNSLATGNSLMRNKQSLKSALAYQTVKRVDPRSLKERSYRMGKQTLIDTLFEEFTRYQYWSLRALRDRLRQPEAWLKECLMEIAEQAPDGPYKNLWRLKPQFAAVQGEAGQTQAPDEQEMTETARRALEMEMAEDGESDAGEEKPKRENGGSDTADDAELQELEGDDDEDMEEVKV